MTAIFIGCGRMGSALATRMAEIDDVYFVDPHVGTVPGVTKLESIGALPALGKEPVILLATKPDGIDAACTALKAVMRPDTLVISIAAGVRLDRLQEMLGHETRVVRMMPNLAVLAGAGVLAVATQASPAAQTREWIERAFAVAGKLFWLRSEEDMDAVTALAGSGPAYLIQFAEHMAEAAQKLGLEETMANDMARLTLTGTGLLVAHSTQSLQEIRGGVTSPKGTTAAALAVLRDQTALGELVRAAMDAAVRRSRDLAAG